MTLFDLDEDENENNAIEKTVKKRNNNKYGKMNIIIKHLENKWTIKKNINKKNQNEYILHKNSDCLKKKIIRLNLFNLKEKYQYTFNDGDSDDYDSSTSTLIKINNTDNGNTPPETNSNENLSDLSDLSEYYLIKFLYNALDNGWKLKKKDNKYFCSKKHNGDARVYEAGYLKDFILDNFIFKGK